MKVKLLVIGGFAGKVYADPVLVGEGDEKIKIDRRSLPTGIQNGDYANLEMKERDVYAVTSFTRA